MNLFVTVLFVSLRQTYYLRPPKWPPPPPPPPLRVPPPPEKPPDDELEPMERLPPNDGDDCELDGV